MGKGGFPRIRGPVWEVNRKIADEAFARKMQEKEEKSRREINMPLNRKIAYIDLTTGDIEIKPIPMEIRKKFLGGRGIDAISFTTTFQRAATRYGPDNCLMVSGGILTATCASATARTHTMAKSPLTGLLGSSNMGGFSPLKWPGPVFITL